MEDNIHNDAVKIKEKYITHYHICDIFSDDAKELYEHYITLKKDAEDKYGTKIFNDYFINFMKDAPGIYSSKIPSLSRQYTHKGIDLWTLVKTALLYKEQADNYASMNYTSSYESSMSHFNKYKAAAIFKYGEEAFETEHSKVSEEHMDFSQYP